MNGIGGTMWCQLRKDQYNRCWKFCLICWFNFERNYIVVHAVKRSANWTVKPCRAKISGILEVLKIERSFSKNDICKLALFILQLTNRHFTNIGTEILYYFASYYVLIRVWHVLNSIAQTTKMKNGCWIVNFGISGFTKNAFICKIYSHRLFYSLFVTLF